MIPARVRRKARRSSSPVISCDRISRAPISRPSASMAITFSATDLSMPHRTLGKGPAQPTKTCVLFIGARTSRSAHDLAEHEHERTWRSALQRLQNGFQPLVDRLDLGLVAGLVVPVEGDAVVGLARHD